MQAVIERELTLDQIGPRNELSFGERIGIFAKLFGCWHKELSRPFTGSGASYRVCLDCGARKRFDAASFRTSGPFYYPPRAVNAG